MKIDRRGFLGIGGAAAASFVLPACRSDGRAPPLVTPDLGDLPVHESAFGSWELEDGLPVFVYRADQDAASFAEWDRFTLPPTRREWLLVGNRALQLQGTNDGTVGIFDESEGLRWLIATEDVGGTGVSVLTDGAVIWGSAYGSRPPGQIPERVFGPTWFAVRTEHAGLSLERTILCPEGDVPWVLVRVRLSLSVDARPRTVTHAETWRLRARFLNLGEQEATRQTVSDSVTYDVVLGKSRIDAQELFDPAQTGTFGVPAALVLDALGDAPASATSDGAPQPVVALVSEVSLAPGETRDLYFRVGRPESDPTGDPAALFERSMTALAARLPSAASARAPAARLEIPWHAAILTGGACRDVVLGGHTLDQGSAYSFVIGFNAAARDPLQHALPLVYTEPDLALSVLQNVLAWGSPDGDLPYALGGDKSPLTNVFRPSDLGLWALWLASEYAAATGDVAAFGVEAPYHPSYKAAPVTLEEHLRLQFRFFVDTVGRGAKGHVRILNADWNDFAITASGVPAADMIANGSSVLNSAMASWVLGVYAGLARRLGDDATAAEAASQSSALRDLVASAYNGSWFHRAYAPDGTPVGDTDCWLEVQPWAILCGAADDTRARALLRLVDQRHRAGSPLGARVLWPVTERGGSLAGEGIAGGIWFSINMTLVWAAARLDPVLAWDEWQKMTLLSHARNFPEVWEGTLSGPDAYNAPESSRPGRTWESSAFAMQSFPVNNLHAHSQPILAYLRLLGVEPTPRGTLAVGKGGAFSSATFSIGESGAGSLHALGDVTLETAHGTVRGGRGVVRW